MLAIVVLLCSDQVCVCVYVCVLCGVGRGEKWKNWGVIHVRVKSVMYAWGKG